MAAIAVCLAGITIFSGCDETENVPDIKPENEAALTQTAFADETDVKSDVTFVAAGAWTSSITEGAASKSAGMATGSVKAGAGSWITITPDHGDAAGKYTMNISLEPNYTGSDRKVIATHQGRKTAVSVSRDRRLSFALSPSHDRVVAVSRSRCHRLTIASSPSRENVLAVSWKRRHSTIAAVPTLSVVSDPDSGGRSSGSNPVGKDTRSLTGWYTQAYVYQPVRESISIEKDAPPPDQNPAWGFI
ncbi:MAG: hypothetical protein LBL24_06480 [Bacteroidales bacterium]|nr:hypothetical protein [Bacteroidales bacterium]